MTKDQPRLKKKVILLGPLPSPYGGVSVYMSALAEFLREKGVRVWALFGARSQSEPHIRFVNHRRFGLIPALLSEGRGARIVDATHFHLEYPHEVLLPLWLALKTALRFEWYKIILDGSLPARYRRFGFMRRLLFRRAVNAISEFIVVSEELRRWLREEIKVSQPVKVIPCLLLIPEQTLNIKLSGATERALASYLRRPRRVCSIGVFIRAYGFAHVAAAVERLRAETGEDIGLALLDGKFAREEEYRAAVLNGRDWITALENVPNPEVYQILRRSDLFVRACEREGYGISRIEALWCGLPVVATKVGEMRGMLLYDFGDEEELLRQMKKALYAPPAQEIERWAAVYRREAAEHLRALTDAIMP